MSTKTLDELTLCIAGFVAFLGLFFMVETPEGEFAGSLLIVSSVIIVFVILLRNLGKG